MGIYDDLLDIQQERQANRVYDELCNALEKTKTKVAWYALGEAVKLAQAVQVACDNHRTGVKGSQEPLVKVAKRALVFLRRMGNHSIPEVVETQKILDRIELEPR